MKVVNYLLIFASVYVLTIGPTHAAEDDHSDDSHAHDHVNEAREDHEESESTHAEISAGMAEQAGIRSKASGAGILERTISSYGRLVPNPDGIALIRARFPGQVTKINASLGDSVKAGDPLASIESNDSLGIGSLSAQFPDFKQYPRARQAVVWPRFESSFARISPDFALSHPIQPRNALIPRPSC